MRRMRWTGMGLLGVCAALLSSCGQTHQDAREPRDTYSVRVVKASFPTHQAVARATSMQLVIHNSGSETVPNLAITIDSFGYRSSYPHLAARERPAWILDQGPGSIPLRPVPTLLTSPGSYVTANTKTWAAGPVGPGQTRSFVWKVTPVKAGSYTVRYAVAAGLNGKAKATVLTAPHRGRFTIQVASQPPVKHVDPDTGQVVPGPAPNVQ